MTWMFSTILWPSNMKADRLRTFNFLIFSKFGKYQTNNSSKSISVGVMDVPQTTHLV
jgi:hypothetical protein